MAIGVEEKSLLERFKGSAVVLSLRGGAEAKARGDRRKFVEEHDRLLREGTHGGPAVAMGKRAEEAKAAMEEAERKFTEAKAAAAEAERGHRDIVDKRLHREIRLADALVASAPPSLRGFLALASRVSEAVRRGLIPMQAPEFADAKAFHRALHEVRREMGKELYLDNDPADIDKRVEAAMLRFRFDLHKVPADVPEPVVF